MSCAKNVFDQKAVNPPLNLSPAMRSNLKQFLEFPDDQTLNDFIRYWNSYQYIVSIDMGCGSTSAAWSPLRQKNYKQTTTLALWRYPNKPGQEKSPNLSIPTMIGYDVEFGNNDKLIIGPEALATWSVAQNFKEIPTDSNLKEMIYDVEIPFSERKIQKSRKMIWEDYFRKIWEHIQDEANARNISLGKANTLIVVAHPASDDWKKVLRNYKNLICEETRFEPAQVITFSEAHAAMQYLNYLGRGNLSLVEGVFVIDLGASTIDVEYLSKDDPTPQEFSITMAGREVDGILGHYFLEQWFPQEMGNIRYKNQIPEQDFFKVHIEDFGGMTRSEFEYNVRVFKEDLCNLALASNYKQEKFFSFGTLGPISFSAEHLQNLLKTTAFPVRIPLVMAAENGIQAQKKTWYEALQELITYSMDTLGDKPLKNIVVTGGSCRLVGVRECIEEGIRKSNRGQQGRAQDLFQKGGIVFLDQDLDYERTVPYGSIYYMTRVLDHLEDMQNFPAQLEATLKEEWISEAAKWLTEEVYAMTEGKIQQALTEWHDLPKEDNNYSPNGLQEIIGKHMGTIRENDAGNCISSGVKKLQKSIDASFSAENPPDPDPFCQTVTCLRNFLQALASTPFTGDLSVKDVALNINLDQMKSKILFITSQADLDALQKGFWGNLQKWFNIYKKAYRNNIYNRFLPENGPQIKEGIHKIVLTELNSAYSGFGLGEQILAKMDKDIKRALFLS